MGKLNKLDIQFDNPQNVCWSGDVMKGYVIAELNGTLKLKGKNIKHTDIVMCRMVILK